MRLFISWSGQRGGAVASALRAFIPLIFQRAEVITTRDDIEKGSRWSTEISNSLKTADMAIICLTPESLGSPWLIFEAGALSESVGPNRLIPLLVGLSPIDLVGPLAQFQAVTTKKSDIYLLVSCLNEDYDLRLTDEMLNKLFDLMWPDFESELEAISSMSGYKNTVNAAPSLVKQDLHDDFENWHRVLKILEKRINDIEKETAALREHEG